MSGITKRYSTIDYAVLKELDVSPNELAYLDMVYYLSKAGTEWCYKSLQAIAIDLNIGKSTVKSMRDRLIDRELLIRNKEGHVKSTEIIHLSYGVRNSHDDNLYRAKNYPNRAKSEQNRAKSAPKNNNRITKNNTDGLAEKKPAAVDHRGTESSAKERIRQALRNGNLRSLKNA